MPDPLTIRPETPADHDAVRRVVTDAFGDHGEVVARLVDALAPYVAASLVAVGPDGDVAGHVQLDRSWLDARERLVDVLVLSPLAVSSAHQGRGTGTALLAAAVEAAEGLGAPLLFLEGDPGYYGRRGFETGRDHGFGRPSARIPEPAFQVRRLAAYQPWMRGGLVYCEPFWSHDCVGLRDPDLAGVEAALGVD